MIGFHFEKNPVAALLRHDRAFQEMRST